MKSKLPTKQKIQKVAKVAPIKKNTTKIKAPKKQTTYSARTSVKEGFNTLKKALKKGFKPMNDKGITGY